MGKVSSTVERPSALQEKREHVRYPVNTNIRVRIGSNRIVQSRLLDVSDGGAFIAAPPRLGPGTVGYLVIDGVGDIPFRAMWQRETEHGGHMKGFGIEFTAVVTEAVAKILELNNEDNSLEPIFKPHIAKARTKSSTSVPQQPKRHLNLQKVVRFATDGETPYEIIGVSDDVDQKVLEEKFKDAISCLSSFVQGNPTVSISMLKHALTKLVGAAEEVGTDIRRVSFDIRIGLRRGEAAQCMVRSRWRALVDNHQKFTAQCPNLLKRVEPYIAAFETADASDPHRFKHLRVALEMDPLNPKLLLALAKEPPKHKAKQKSDPSWDVLEKLFC